MPSRNRSHEIARDYVDVLKILSPIYERELAAKVVRYRRFVEHWAAQAELEPLEELLLVAAHAQPEDCPIRRDAVELEEQGIRPRGRWLRLNNPESTDHAPERIRCVWGKAVAAEEDAFRSLVFTPDGRYGVACGSDELVRVWDLETTECWALPHEHTETVNALVVGRDPGGLELAVTCAQDNTLRLWDLKKSSLVRVIGVLTEAVTCLALNGDATRVLSGCNDKSVRLWDLNNGACLVTIVEFSRIVTAVQLSPDARLAVVCEADGRVSAWNLKSPTPNRLWPDGGNDEAPADRHEFQVRINTLAVDWDEGLVITGTDDGRVHLTSLEHGSSVAEPVGFGPSVTALVLDVEQGLALIGTDSPDGKVLGVWPYREARSAVVPAVRWLAPGPPVLAAAISPDGHFALSYSMSGGIWYWDLDAAVSSSVESRRRPDATCVALSADGTRTLTGHRDGRARLQSTSSPTMELGGIHSGEVTAAAITPDGLWAATGCRDGLVYIREVNRVGHYSTLTGPSHPVVSLSVSTDGKRVAAIDAHCNLFVWPTEFPAKISSQQSSDPADSRLFHTVAFFEGSHELRTAGPGIVGQWAPDGQNNYRLIKTQLGTSASLVLLGHAGEVSLSTTPPTLHSRIPKGFRTKKMRLPPSPIRAISVASDRRWAYTGDGDRVVRVWDLDAEDASRPIASFPTPFEIRSVVSAALDPTVLAACDRMGHLFLLRLVYQ